MNNFSESHLQATNGHTYPIRLLNCASTSFVDACAVQADYGHLLSLTAEGTLYGINFDTGVSVQLCIVELPDIAFTDEVSHFGPAQYRLYASANGKYAAIVVDKGRTGIVIEIPSGSVTMRLNGGDYCEETVPFSACFLSFEGRDVFVHRTAWNRLDVADPATGESLTDRYIAPYEAASKEPAHYLDYFHGLLRPSPNGTRIFDDGWVWHPVSIPRAWSVTEWLRSNRWESEDGASIVDLTQRDDWNTSACWISEQHVALWGLADWDENEFEETGQGAGVRIFDVTERKQSSERRWAMEIHAKTVNNMFSDGMRLYVAADSGTTAWDLVSRELITRLPDFTARLHDRARNTLLAIGSDTIIEFPLASLVAKSTGCYVVKMGN